jgi:hypothetical protein
MQSGATVVVIDPEASPHTQNRSYALQGQSGRLLPALVAAAWPTS